MPRFAMSSTCTLKALSAGIVFAAAAATPFVANAQDTPASSSLTAQTPTSLSDHAKLEEHIAHDWGLDIDEWTRYRTLMQGPLGIYAPHLDPLTALGIEARTDEERRRYAEIQVRAEARRVEKMLAYQRTYDAAWKRLYPALQRVELNRIPSAMDAREGPGRLTVFVKDACPPCDQRVRQLQAAGSAFDIYMVGSRQDDARIRQWAAKAGIEPASVRAGVITLNHDAGRWLAIGLPGDLPAVLHDVDGQWQRW